MTQALWVAKTGLDAQQHNVSVIANNLANVNTVGFKKDRAVFESLVYQTVRQAGGQSSEDTMLPSGLNLGTGVRTSATQKIHTVGNILQTDNNLDIAINGRGFLQVLMPNGQIGFTRAGQMQLNENNQIVTSSGYVMQPPITLPQETVAVTISNDGIVTAAVGQAKEQQQVGNIQISDFINPAGLQPIGENLFIETAASGSPQTGTPGTGGLGGLINGALESSNVNVVGELVNLIEAQRAYEMNSKAISAVDQMMQYADQVL